MLGNVNLFTDIFKNSKSRWQSRDHEKRKRAKLLKLLKCGSGGGWKE